MVKLKSEKQPFDPGWLQRELDRVDAENPIIDTRYYVVEESPSVREPIYNGDGHGGTTYEWSGARQVIVSDYFTEESEADDFINTHELDEGKTLKKRKQHKRRTVIERWV